MILFLLYSFSTAYGNIALISINSLKCDWDCRQAKDALKILKKRLGSKNPKIQLLALFVSIFSFLPDFLDIYFCSIILINKICKIRVTKWV